MEKSDTKSYTVSLKEERFIPVVLNGNPDVIFYGGDQNRFLKYGDRASACGTVAAANLFAYIYRNSAEFKSMLPRSASVITAEQYLAYMTEVIKYVSPLRIPVLNIPVWGITSSQKFAEMCGRFIKAKNLRMTAYVISNKTSDMDEAAEMIADQLAKDNPVALLNLRNPGLKNITYTDSYGKTIKTDFQFHWVVITSIKKHNDGISVTVSSEGSKAILDFREIWDSKKYLLNTADLVYFERQSTLDSRR